MKTSSHVSSLHADGKSGEVLVHTASLQGLKSEKYLQCVETVELMHPL